MSSAEWVVDTFSALGESGKASALPQGPDAITPARENLVRIGLMTYIPNQLVAGSIEYIVQGDREFHDTQTGPKVPTRRSYRADGLGAKLFCNLMQVCFVKAT